jgi:hypothetical protein
MSTGRRNAKRRHFANRGTYSKPLGAKAERDLLELIRADRLVMNKRQVAQEAEGFDSKLAEKKKAASRSIGGGCW